MTNAEKIVEAKARELAFCGCGCDDDATEGCPNWNGERCTYAEFCIAAALRDARAEGIREAAAKLRRMSEDTRRKIGMFDGNKQYANQQAVATHAIDIAADVVEELLEPNHD